MARIVQIIVALLLAAVATFVYGPHLKSAVLFALGHMLISVLVLLVYGILFGLVGADYGLPNLYWHDQLRTRLGAATAVTLLLALVEALAYYAAGTLDGPVAGPDPAPVNALLGSVWPALAAKPAAHNSERLELFLLVTSPPFLALLLAPALIPALFPRVPRSVPEILISRERVGPTIGRTMSVESNFWAYALGLVTWLAGIVLGVLIVFLLIRVGRGVGRWSVLWTVGNLTDSRRALLMFSTVFVLFYVILSFRPVYERIVSPAFAITALMGLLATAYAMIAYFFPWSIPGGMTLVFLAVALWFALVNNSPYKLRFPAMDLYYPGGAKGLVSLTPAVSASVRALGDEDDGGGRHLVSDEEALANWRRSVMDRPATAAEKPAKPKLTVVAVSGGALRSGLWVAIVLDRLEKQIPGFGRSVRLITGASGGMLGAGYYLNHRREVSGVAEPSAASGPYRPSEWVLAIPRDSLDPVARFIGLRDPFLALLPRLVADDRGIRLERAWPGLAFPFRDLSPLEAAGTIPSMILSPMLIEDGRRLLISNLDLRRLVGARGGAIGADDPLGAIRTYSLSALEFTRLFPEAKGFRLGTGVRMNASFPYVSPAVSLPTDPPRRVFDAGVYDNYGVQVAAAWIHKNFDWLLANTSGVVLVQIRDAISVDARLGAAPLSTKFLDRLLRGFRFFTSAPEAAESGRTSAAMFHNDDDVAALSERFTAAKGGDCAFFSTVIFENSAVVTFRPPDPGAWPGDESVVTDSGTGVALNWYLSRAERDSLIAAIPAPPPGSQWVDRTRRLGRIHELRGRAEAATGPARAETLTQLEQAENFERLVQLDTWWTRP